MIHCPDRPEILARLRAAAPSVLPSLLLCDFGNLERELEQLQEAAITSLHFDVMDGVFVPNFTYGMPIIAALRDRTNLIFDVHLMITEPAGCVKHFRNAGADVITIHAEAVDDDREDHVVVALGQPGVLDERPRLGLGVAGVAPGACEHAGLVTLESAILDEPVVAADLVDHGLDALDLLPVGLEPAHAAFGDRGAAEDRAHRRTTGPFMADVPGADPVF